ncbi:MAG: sensor domain-containing diguanylate cyclase, partial [Deltaproteobacteria bacterium]|nr:sensor domain-containing diguanylate cyclase [Deltaproteobacteria bacterium]
MSVNNAAAEKGKETSKLFEILRLFNMTSDANRLEEGLKILLKIVETLTMSPKAAFAICHDLGNCGYLMVSYGLSDGEKTELDEFLKSQTETQHAPDKRSVFINIGDGQQSAGPAAPFYKNGYLAPLLNRFERIGFLFAEPPAEKGNFDRRDVEYLSLVAMQGTSMIMNHRLQYSLKKRVGYLSSLYEIGQMITSTLNSEQVLQLIVKNTCELVDAEISSIMFIDDANQFLTIRTGQGLPEEVMKYVKIKVGEGISGYVALSGEPLYIKDIENDDRFKKAKSGSKRYNNRSLISVPLRAKGQVVGVLNVNNKKDGSPFHEDDFELVKLFAQQASIAIENAKLHERLFNVAITDGLTETYVHRYFKETFDRIVGDSNKTAIPLCFVMIDIDHFKWVNDRYGHIVGDSVLKKIAAILKDAVRGHDIVARYGGEEFAVVLTNCTMEIAASVADRLRKKIENFDFSQLGCMHPITASFGISGMPADGSEPQILIDVADKRLLRAKESGRNQVSA